MYLWNPCHITNTYNHACKVENIRSSWRKEFDNWKSCGGCRRQTPAIACMHAGLGAKYLYEELKSRTDPLSPDNVLILMTGPLIGTMAPCTPQQVVVTKSPATSTFLDSYVGGDFGAESKFASFDAIILRGGAKSPIYLWVHDGRAEIKDAKGLWGKDTQEAERLLKEELRDKEIRVAGIGPAGENLVKFSCITSELHRQAGSGGAGVVTGSKKLKAIATRGTGYVSVPDIEGFSKLCRDIIEKDVLGNPDNEWAIVDGTHARICMHVLQLPYGIP